MHVNLQHVFKMSSVVRMYTCFEPCVFLVTHCSRLCQAFSRQMLSQILRWSKVASVAFRKKPVS